MQKLTIISAIIVLSHTLTFSQETGIRGKVTDSSGNPLSGILVTFPVPLDFGRHDPLEFYASSLQEEDERSINVTGPYSIAQIRPVDDTEEITLVRSVTTPNGDGINDIFQFETTERSITDFKIYDDQGQPVEDLILRIEEKKVYLRLIVSRSQESRILEAGNYAVVIELDNADVVNYEIANIEPVATDENGNYVLGGLLPGIWSIRVAYIDDRDDESDIIIDMVEQITVNNSGFTTVNFTVNESDMDATAVKGISWGQIKNY